MKLIQDRVLFVSVGFTIDNNKNSNLDITSMLSDQRDIYNDSNLVLVIKNLSVIETRKLRDPRWWCRVDLLSPVQHTWYGRPLCRVRGDVGPTTLTVRTREDDLQRTVSWSFVALHLLLRVRRGRSPDTLKINVINYQLLHVPGEPREGKDGFGDEDELL